MASRPLPTPLLLKESIVFVTVGTFASVVCVLLFEDRLYRTADLLLLFATLFVLFVAQAFLGRWQGALLVRHAVLFYVRSFVLTAAGLLLLFAVALPFPFDLALSAKLCLLVTLVETSLQMFFRYRRQWAVNATNEQRLDQAIRQQQVKEIEVLKQQIDPHFIFNSFNTLAFLIEADSGKAQRFSNKLANVYRYIIFNSNKNLVSVADELAFAKDYAYLQEIRHSNEVEIRFAVDPIDNGFVLPVSLQLLIENAIKHNAFSTGTPLRIQVMLEKDLLVVENNVQPSPYQQPSSKIGLSNLRNRCRLILGRDLEIVHTAGEFRVALPVLTK